MMIPSLKNYLQSQQVEHTLINHPTEYTAQEVAAVSHVPGDTVGKAVAVLADGELMICVVPAHYYIDLEALATEIGAFDVELAQESDFINFFDDCEPGAIVPFAEVFGVPVWISEAFQNKSTIAVNAGTWSDLVLLNCEDYSDLNGAQWFAAAQPCH